MPKNKKRAMPVLIFLFFALFLVSNIDFSQLSAFNDGFYTSYEEINEANESKKFGSLIKLSMKDNQLSTGLDKNQSGDVIFKLFGFIPIKKVTVKILPEEEVYTGGEAIGLAVNTDGAMVVSDTVVDVQSRNILKNKYLKNGDIIQKINGQPIQSVSDIDKVLSQNVSDNIDVELIRDNKQKTINVGLLKDSENQYKLGVWAKNDLSGIGTLTFVRKSDFSFGALGHPVSNGQQNSVVPITGGNIFDCSLIGINKGQRNKPGELRGVFVQRNEQGTIKKNTNCGVFGKIDEDSNLFDSNRSLKIGGRLGIHTGKAKIISSVSGILEEYDIEIIKANYQAKSSDKSLVIRVKDERLLNLTGGIVQGMSGSPIVQDGKLVGAVTHVFLNDPTKGYGIYSDWMLEQLDF